MSSFKLDEIKPVQAFVVSFTKRNETYKVIVVDNSAETLFWKGEEVPDHNFHSHGDAIRFAIESTPSVEILDESGALVTTVSERQYAMLQDEAGIAAAEEGADREWGFCPTEFEEWWIPANLHKFLPTEE